MNDAKIAELRAEHGEIAVIATQFGVFVFRPPELDEWENFKEILNAAGRGQKVSVAAAQREVCQKCLADQTQLASLQQLFKKKPGLISPLTDKLGELGGSNIEIVIKKD